MTQLQQIFEMTAGADADAVLSTPNLAYVVELLRRSGETLSVDDLEQIYADEGWLTDRSFTWLEMQALQDRIQPTALPAALVAAEKKESPGEVPPAFPVDVGGVDAEEQAIRQTLLARAIPEDLALAESLMAPEYANFVQGQAAEMRS